MILDKIRPNFRGGTADMNLQQLYYFQAISRLKNYTKAAEQLLVAQSSLSHSIGDLERELGVPLFFKVGRNIDITEYGKQFLIHVDRITAELELANQELKNMLNPNMGKIRIALAYTVSNRFIPNMIKGFYENEDNRAVQFEFSEKQAAKIIDAFANRDHRPGVRRPDGQRPAGILSHF